MNAFPLPFYNTLQFEGIQNSIKGCPSHIEKGTQLGQRAGKLDMFGILLLGLLHQIESKLLFRASGCISGNAFI